MERPVGIAHSVMRLSSSHLRELAPTVDVPLFVRRRRAEDAGELLPVAASMAARPLAAVNGDAVYVTSTWQTIVHVARLFDAARLRAFRRITR